MESNDVLGSIASGDFACRLKIAQAAGRGLQRSGNPADVAAPREGACPYRVVRDVLEARGRRAANLEAWLATARSIPAQAAGAR